MLNHEPATTITQMTGKGVPMLSRRSALAKVLVGQDWRPSLQPDNAITVPAIDLPLIRPTLACCRKLLTGVSGV